MSKLSWRKYVAEDVGGRLVCHLSHEARIGYSSNRPMKVLLVQPTTGIVPPVYRLRLGDYEHYRIVDDRVVVLAILHKKDS